MQCCISITSCFVCYKKLYERPHWIGAALKIIMQYLFPMIIVKVTTNYYKNDMNLVMFSGNKTIKVLSFQSILVKQSHQISENLTKHVGSD